MVCYYKNYIAPLHRCMYNARESPGANNVGYKQFRNWYISFKESRHTQYIRFISEIFRNNFWRTPMSIHVFERWISECWRKCWLVSFPSLNVVKKVACYWQSVLGPTQQTTMKAKHIPYQMRPVRVNNHFCSGKTMLRYRISSSSFYWLLSWRLLFPASRPRRLSLCVSACRV